MSTSNTPKTVSIPTPEALNLSANLFNSTVSSWLPANFGHAIPAVEAEKEWQTLLRSAGEGKDRLGLGHPAINAPKVGGGGFKGLERSLKNGKRKLGEEEKERGDVSEKVEPESDEEDSRASMVGKRKKVGTFDFLGGKKKKIVKVSTATTSAETSARASPAAVDIPDKSTLTEAVPKATTPPPSSDLPSTSNPESSTLPPSTSTSPVKSKSALKREKKKLAKLAKAKTSRE